MSFTLQLVFSGLIAFAPTNDQVKVVLVSADQLPSGYTGDYLKHDSFVEFDCKYLADTGQAPCRDRFKDSPMDFMNRIRLNAGYTLVISPEQGSPPSGFLVDKSFNYWVPIMKDLSPSASKIRSDNDLKGLANLIFTMKYGTLAAAAPEEAGSYDQHRWHFKRSNGDEENLQKVSSEVTLTVTFDDSAKGVLLDFEPVDPGATGKKPLPFKLTLRPQQEGDTISVWLTNEPNTLEYCRHPLVGGMFSGYALGHFGMYYLVSNPGFKDSEKVLPIADFKSDRDQKCAAYIDCLVSKKGCGRLPIICMSVRMEQ